MITSRVNPTTALLTVHLLAHLTIPLMVIYGSLWWWVGGLLWWQFVAATAVSSGYHRYFAHRTFQAPRWYPLYAQVLAVFSNAGSILAWAGAHRMHHAFSDTDKDPHSPRFKGIMRVLFNFWGYDVVIPRRFIKDLLRDKQVLFFHQYYFDILLGIAVLFALIDPRLFLFGLCLPIISGFWGMGLLNVLAHTGDDVPRNSALANVLTGGEGWHRNHHRRAGDWRIGWKWWQIDTGAWWIWLIKTDR